ncbi:filamentous hemagglutinin N-terminal domain-containing protein [Yersinia thracica]|uniref:two-partner secretion domain-containing protein n=1 Tax=Yersinia thracica TaxID=2890319 RepID=UPI0011A26A02|nr:filamentous hemagglutinin N-terminal domain-containing protein [Yersinia thracica]
MINTYLYSDFNIKNGMIILHCFLYFTIPLSYAEIVVDKNAPLHQQPGVSSIYIKWSETHCKALNAHCRGANYTAINIQTPNEQGVSHNKYVKFDVINGGGYDKVSLNNYLASSATGNPNLITKPAKVILNEVTSGNKSLLNGELIVAGEKAHVIIANPAGISCDGCYFSNIDHVTLTTGLPMFSGGGPLGYQVSRGVIDIDARGLKHDESNDTYLDFFANSLKIGGEIRSGDILAIIGRNTINYAPIDGKVNVKSLVGTSSGNKNNLGVDVSHLGGMYANKIFVFSRNNGVKNSGVLHAEKKLVIASNRFIKNNHGKICSGNIILRSLALIDNQQGTIKNIRLVPVTSAEEKFGINITGKTLNNKEGYIHSNIGDVLMTADGNFYNSGGLIKTVGSYGHADIKIKAKLVNNFNGAVITSNNILINTDSLKNNQGRVVSAFGTVTLRYKTLEDTTGVLHGGMGVKKTIK